MRLENAFYTEHVARWDILSPRRFTAVPEFMGGYGVVTPKGLGGSKKRRGASLRSVERRLRSVGLLDAEEEVTFLIYDNDQKPFRTHDNNIGLLKALVSRDGKVTVREMHVNPDKVEEVRQLFASTDVKVEELPWG